VDAAALTAFLAPFLPYLLTVGKELADDAARSFGAAAWEHAQQLWGRLRGAVEDRPATAEAARDLAAAPDDPRALTVLEVQLEKLLRSDPALARDLGERWRQGAGVRATIASGERSVAIGGSVHGSVIHTGDHGRGG
jgi:hypothetical protein